MEKTKNISAVALALMAALALGSLLPVRLGATGLSLASLTLAVGIPMYFILWQMEKAHGGVDLLAFKAVPHALANKGVLVLLVLPVVMNIVCNALAALFLPAFTAHLAARTAFLAVNRLPLLCVQFAVAALGEEIAWRAFFQARLAKMMPAVPALVLSAALFAVCHTTQGDLAVVLYDLFFVFVNALLYGLLFQKTNNAVVSALAHFLANLSAAAMLLL